MKDVNIGVALTKEACQLCGALMEGPVAINMYPDPTVAAKIEEFEGKCIGYAKEPCPSCKECMEKGFVLIGVDEDQTTDQANPYRSGQKWVISHEKAKELFTDEALELGWMWLSTKVAARLGLPLEIV